MAWTKGIKSLINIDNVTHFIIEHNPDDCNIVAHFLNGDSCNIFNGTEFECETYMASFTEGQPRGKLCKDLMG